MVTRLAFLLCAALVITASPVWACGVMERADPRVGSTVHEAADHVAITFSEAVVPAASGIAITDAAGHRVETGALAASTDDSVLSLTIPPLAPGKYKVSWNVLWKDCNSQTHGSYKFTVQ